MILGRPWYDTLLLIYIAAVFLLMAYRIRRESSLGWSVSSLCLAMAILFGFAIASVAWPPMTAVLSVVRAGVCATLTWVLWELQLRGWVMRDDHDRATRIHT